MEEVVDPMTNLHVDIMADHLMDLQVDILANPLTDLQMNILENLLSALQADILVEFRVDPLTELLTTLIVHPGSGSGRTSPMGEETQGPSPVDYNIELKADFPKEMVIEMQGNAAKKARKTVIRRTLGGRASFKTLQESLKLHLPATFVSATLLTRGFFLILFEDEEGATSTKKLATVEWSGLNLSFSKYNPNFDANAQGAEALFTHVIKVQFPDLHEQFRNKRALTIMASKLGEVLDIEAADSYMKRPTGPMDTIEVKDIAKLAGYIRIPSMAEGAAFTDTIRQKKFIPGFRTSVGSAIDSGIKLGRATSSKTLRRKERSTALPYQAEWITGTQARTRHPRSRHAQERKIPQQHLVKICKSWARTKDARNRNFQGARPRPHHHRPTRQRTDQGAKAPTRGNRTHRPELRRTVARPTPLHRQARQRKEPGWK
ncbi:unnamed protein product [Sphagnum troendelagicum]|uniref:Uncharacterized protein n=1 Tax=Sphagnum troendelagicum TaxID=128251 RepID=A0ABP0UXT0_9BRYO